jgi:endoglucanase
VRNRTLQLVLVGLALAGGICGSVVFLAQSVAETKAAPPAGTPTGRVTYAGVNASGAEFAPQAIPGLINKNYIYPKPGAISHYAALGANAVRLPVRWERVQAALMGPLDTAEISRIDASVTEANAKGVLLILDIHNYARYRNRLVDEDVSAGLADLWAKLAGRYRDKRVAFGIMNEPHDISAADWRRAADRTVGAIRATGAGNLVLVPGTLWTGAHSWQRNGTQSNAAAFTSFTDKNFAFDLHQYLDRNSSGSTFDCGSDPQVGVRRLQGVTQWLRERKVRGFLGEFAAGKSDACQQALAAMLQYMDQNSDVWLGWTYWTAGPWWPESYEFGIEPRDGGWPVRARAIRDAFAARQGK